MISVVKIALRRELFLAKSARDQERIDLLESVLNDNDMLGMVTEAIVAEYEYVHGGHLFAEKGGPFGGAFANLLKFVIENRESILSLVKIVVTILAIV